MVIAVVLSFIGIALGMISLRCTTMIENDSKKKSFIGIASGTCIFLAGQLVKNARVATVSVIFQPDYAFLQYSISREMNKMSSILK